MFVCGGVRVVAVLGMAAVGRDVVAVWLVCVVVVWWVLSVVSGGGLVCGCGDGHTHQPHPTHTTVNST